MCAGVYATSIKGTSRKTIVDIIANLKGKQATHDVIELSCYSCSNTMLYRFTAAYSAHCHFLWA